MHRLLCVVCPMYPVKALIPFLLIRFQETHIGILDANRSHIVGKDLRFTRVKSGPYLRASRLTPGTVGAKRWTRFALASQISDPSLPRFSWFSSSVLRGAIRRKMRRNMSDK